jgi:hypothetical protein
MWDHKAHQHPDRLTNQKAAVMGSAPEAMSLCNAITVGTIPSINRFIESSSGMKALVSERE